MDVLDIKLTGVCKNKVELELTPRYPSNFNLHCEALVLSNLTHTQPDEYLAANSWDDNHNHILADPTYHSPGPIDLLIGADSFADIILDGINITENGMLAQKMQFVWTLLGKARFRAQNNQNLVSMITRTNIDEQLKTFWQIEAVLDDTTTNEEKKCEDLYESTTRRNRDRTYS